jgi:hypothetical protein
MLLSCLVVGVALAVMARPVAAQEPGKPGPEHQMLKKFEGQWDATMTFTGAPGQSKARASYKLGLGGLWLEHHFKGDFGGMAFEGRGITGYDPRKKKYVSMWVDSMEPWMLTMEGNFAKDGKTYTETGESVGMDGQPEKVKSVFEFKDQDTIVFTMYKVADNKDQQMMQITYKRQKK